MSDPAFRKDRACNGVSVDVFFPPPRRTRLVQQAQAFCVGCPVRAECAAWAAPLVETRELSDCVVAGVHLPIDHSDPRYKAPRAAAAKQLREIAAGREAVVNEGGTAWTAA